MGRGHDRHQQVLVVLALLLLAWCGVATTPPKQPITCFVVRTYYGHGQSKGNGALRAMLQSLLQQSSDRWVALLSVLDSQPFQELRYLVHELGDPRISVFAEWVDLEAVAFPGLSWSPEYLVRLHTLTDEAIRACPPHTQMVVVTNGDNLYDRQFVSEVEQAAADGADIVAFDFYSRYQRPTASPCERLAWSEGVPPCKENEATLCQTDFAANAYRWQQLVSGEQGGFRFDGVAEAVTPQGTGEAAVGIVTSALVAEGWKLHRVAGRCLVHHVDNPQHCATLEGMAWDDSILFSDEAYGGSCVPLNEVIVKASRRPHQLELVQVNLTFDRDSFAFSERGTEPLQLTCLRMSQPSAWRHVEKFGRLCASRLDVASLPEDLAPHPWESLFDEEDEVDGQGSESNTDSLQEDAVSEVAGEDSTMASGGEEGAVAAGSCAADGDGHVGGCAAHQE